MKNKILTLLTVTMLTGSMLVGCGSSETGANENTGVNTEITIDKENDSSTETESSLATIQADVGYIEGEYYFGVPSEEYLDTTYVDGETLDTSSWESVGELITIQESINVFDANKNIMGYFKPGVECVYMSTNGEWSRIALGKDLVNFNGTVIVRTEDLLAVIDEEISLEGSNVMSDSAKAFFDKIRAGVIEDNKTIEEYAEEHPEVPVWYLEEANSPDGMDCIDTFYFNPEEDYEMAMDVIGQLVYNKGYSKYYLEYLSESNGVVEFKIYGGK